MTDLTDEQINEQIEAAYETLGTVVEQLGKKGASLIIGSAEQAGIAVNSTDVPAGVSLIGVSDVPHTAYAFAGGVIG